MGKVAVIVINNIDKSHNGIPLSFLGRYALIEDYIEGQKKYACKISGRIPIKESNQMYFIDENGKEQKLGGGLTGSLSHSILENEFSVEGFLSWDVPMDELFHEDSKEFLEGIKLDEVTVSNETSFSKNEILVRIMVRINTSVLARVTNKFLKFDICSLVGSTLGKQISTILRRIDENSKIEKRKKDLE